MNSSNILHDKRIDCYSVMTEMEVSDFLAIVENSYKNRGGIEGQRSPLKTKTALTIRKRMVEDVKRKAVLPAIVLGIHIENVNELLDNINNNGYQYIVEHVNPEAISIIDGMQRTTALKEAGDSISKEIVRVEFWITDKLNSLIYRMLVLNTGQVPWEMARQLETVYSQLLKSIKNELSEYDISIFIKDEKPRRLENSQYEANKIIQLYIIFSSRRYDINIKDKVAEDFAKLDVIETNSFDNFFSYFIKSFELLLKLNAVFSKATSDEKSRNRISSGKDIFSSDTALAGFFSAISIKLFNKAGYAINSEDVIQSTMDRIYKKVNNLIDKLETKSKDEITDFLSLLTLDERLNQKSGQVGKFERELFYNAFTVLIDDADKLENLDPCWMVSY
ncbi:hypothetical protein [Aggregatibacter actinomycetemcomitans]|uniref:hypothetical protein n=1 Tax=Aggregatibacter actinomycetemcomitans TaxID=714 RepID=UPI00197C1F17|nr:hypothetical protein [Aggregatibacter actinomycetemcomitans]MBN6064692.1 hypothetical protein [Aggregatibacter actinomycetemcomitans]MBN6074376.1 hypothetical protein [Aggregatibacter actinomycetemcomitans]MBN6084619.1 hypothetical protein [Aggregatibacter actinomycetemcomitans]